MRFLVRCVIVLALAATVSAQWPDAWRNWRYSAAIVIPTAPAAGLVALRVPDAVTSRARRGWTDVRVIDRQGREVPFMLRAEFGGRSLDRRQVPLLEPTAVPNAYRQVIIDAGPNSPVHNSLTLTIQVDANLLTFVEVAVSGDMKEWNVIRDRAPIYVLVKEGRGQNTDVSYPNSASRYVRVRVLDGTTAYTIASATLGYDLFTPADRVAAAATLVAAAESGQSRQSVWTSDGDLSAFPISAVEFTTSRPSFSRSVSIAISEDGGRWMTIGGDTIQVPAPPGGRAKLVIDTFQETYARRWRITVNNLNDAAIADLQPVLLTVPRRVVFRPAQGESYRLLFGHPRAAAPRYDISQLTDAKMLASAAPATLGAEEVNGTWVDPTPWTERYHGVLWTALAAAAILLGVAAMRALRAPA